MMLFSLKEGSKPLKKQRMDDIYFDLIDVYRL